LGRQCWAARPFEWRRSLWTRSIIQSTNFDRNVAAKTNRKLADAATYSFDRPRVLNDSELEQYSTFGRDMSIFAE
jgi:hypothetical protein